MTLYVSRPPYRALPSTPALATLPKQWAEFLGELVEMLEYCVSAPILIIGGIHCTDDTLAIFKDLAAEAANVDPVYTMPLFLHLGAKAGFRASGEIRVIEAPVMIDWSDLTR